MIFLILIPLLIIACMGYMRFRQWNEASVRLDEIISELAAGRRPKSFVRSGPQSLVRLSNQIEKVSELQLALQRQLQEEGYSHQVILKGMIEGVLIVDHEKKIQLANEPFCTFFNIDKTPTGLTVMEATRFIELDRLIQQTLRSKSAQSSELQLQQNNNAAASPYLLINTFPFPIQSIGTTGVVLVCHNITRMKQLEEVRKEFVSNVSHELKTPLAIFQGYVETLLDNPQLEAKDQSRIHKTLLRHSHRLNALVEDLLSLARLESRRIPLQFEIIDLHSYLEPLQEDWKKQIEAKEIKLVITLPPETLPIEIDLLRFEQILSNLMDNAIKYSKKEGTIHLSFSKKLEHIEMTIQDQGIGIPASDLPHIFERFYRVDKARSREMGGTGLGLSIVKHIVLLHQGTIEAESEEGEGTTIRVYLPLRQNL